jgi:methyl-accepting chemotaxis protein
MKNISIKIKLFLCTVPALVILLTASIVFTLMIRSTYVDSKDVYFDTLYEINNNLLNADRDFYQAMQASTDQFHMVREQGKLGTDKSAANNKAYEDNVAQVKSRVTKAMNIAAENEDLYTQINDANGENFATVCDEFFTVFDKWYAGFDAGKPSSDETKFNGYSVLFEDAREHLNSLQEITENWAVVRNDAFSKRIQNMMVFMFALIAVLSVGLILLTAYIIRSLVKGVGSITENMVILARNDLTVQVREDNGKDEIGKMNNAFATFKKNLYGAVSTMNEASGQLEEAFVTMKDRTNSAHNSMREISKAALELANSATMQAEDVSDIVSSMTELNSIMNKSVETAQSLTDASNQIDGVTKQGKETVYELSKINKDSLSAFNKIFESIESIRTLAEKISEASGLISGIANQTNLLSLNASIEAARAGEQGRGFAVVAEEIRKLSDESKTNVEVITGILGELAVATDEATRLSGEVKEYVSKQNDSVENTGNAFGDIVNTVGIVYSAIGEIENINKVLEEKVMAISESVESLSSISEENAATAQELSATSELVKKSVNELVDTQEHVGSASENLNNIVKTFKLK